MGNKRATRARGGLLGAFVALLVVASPASAKDVKLSPINFGNVPVGETVSETIRIENRGGPLPLFGQHLGSDDGLFAFGSHNTCPVFELIGSCEAEVLFTPHRTGPIRGEYCIGGYCLTLRGHGRSPR